MRFSRPHEPLEEMCNIRLELAAPAEHQRAQHGEIPADLCKIYAHAGNVYRRSVRTRVFMRGAPHNQCKYLVGTKLAYLHHSSKVGNLPVNIGKLRKPKTSSSFTFSSSLSEVKVIVPVSAAGIFLPVELTYAHPGIYLRSRSNLARGQYSAAARI